MFKNMYLTKLNGMGLLFVLLWVEADKLSTNSDVNHSLSLGPKEPKDEH